MRPPEASRPGDVGGLLIARVSFIRCSQGHPVTAQGNAAYFANHDPASGLFYPGLFCASLFYQCKRIMRTRCYTIF